MTVSGCTASCKARGRAPSISSSTCTTVSLVLKLGDIRKFLLALGENVSPAANGANQFALQNLIANPDNATYIIYHRARSKLAPAYRRIPMASLRAFQDSLLPIQSRLLLSDRDIRNPRRLRNAASCF